jgi:hypothetical protein
MTQVDPARQKVLDPPTTVDSIGSQYLSARAGTNLRDDVVTVNGRAKSWSGAVEAFEGYIWRQAKAADTWAEEKGVRPNSHRFSESASKDRYGRTLGVDRAAKKLWGDSLTTVHVVRRARPFGRDGQPQPPVDHLMDLLAGNHNVYRAYDRHIEENHSLQYGRLSVLEPHRNGYGHIHDGLWVNDPDAVLDDIDILPAVDAHLKAVPQAQPRNHGPGSVSVRHDPKGRQSEKRVPDADTNSVVESTALPPELSKYLAGMAEYDDSSNSNVPRVLQTDRGPLRFYALLWATGIRQWRPDHGMFDHLVKASQEWYREEDQQTEDTDFVSPQDIANHSGIETVDVDARPVDFERIEVGCTTAP